MGKKKRIAKNRKFYEKELAKIGKVPLYKQPEEHIKEIENIINELDRKRKESGTMLYVDGKPVEKGSDAYKELFKHCDISDETRDKIAKNTKKKAKKLAKKIEKASSSTEIASIVSPYLDNNDMSDYQKEIAKITKKAFKEKHKQQIKNNTKKYKNVKMDKKLIKKIHSATLDINGRIQLVDLKSSLNNLSEYNKEYHLSKNNKDEKDNNKRRCDIIIDVISDSLDALIDITGVKHPDDIKKLFKTAKKTKDPNLFTNLIDYCKAYIGYINGSNIKGNKNSKKDKKKRKKSYYAKYIKNKNKKSSSNKYAKKLYNRLSDLYNITDDTTLHLLKKVCKGEIDKDDISNIDIVPRIRTNLVYGNKQMFYEKELSKELFDDEDIMLYSDSDLNIYKVMYGTFILLGNRTEYINKYYLPSHDSINNDANDMKNIINNLYTLVELEYCRENKDFESDLIVNNSEQITYLDKDNLSVLDYFNLVNYPNEYRLSMYSPNEISRCNIEYNQKIINRLRREYPIICSDDNKFLEFCDEIGILPYAEAPKKEFDKAVKRLAKKSMDYSFYIAMENDEDLRNYCEELEREREENPVKFLKEELYYAKSINNKKEIKRLTNLINNDKNLLLYGSDYYDLDDTGKQNRRIYVESMYNLYREYSGYPKELKRIIKLLADEYNSLTITEQIERESEFEETLERYKSIYYDMPLRVLDIDRATKIACGESRYQFSDIDNRYLIDDDEDVSDNVNRFIQNRLLQEPQNIDLDKNASLDTVGKLMIAMNDPAILDPNNKYYTELDISNLASEYIEKAKKKANKHNSSVLEEYAKLINNLDIKNKHPELYASIAKHIQREYSDLERVDEIVIDNIVNDFDRNFLNSEVKDESIDILEDVLEDASDGSVYFKNIEFLIESNGGDENVFGSESEFIKILNKILKNNEEMEMCQNTLITLQCRLEDLTEESEIIDMYKDFFINGDVEDECPALFNTFIYYLVTNAKVDDKYTEFIIWIKRYIIDTERFSTKSYNYLGDTLSNIDVQNPLELYLYSDLDKYMSIDEI